MTSRLRLLRNGGPAPILRSESPAANSEPPQPTALPPPTQCHPRAALSHRDLTGDAGGAGRQQKHRHVPYSFNEEALDDLLDGLDDDFDLTYDVDFDPSHLGRSPNDNDQKPLTLLEDLQTPTGHVPAPDDPASDSDAEPTSREVDKLLSQLRDELNLSAQDSRDKEEPSSELMDTTATEAEVDALGLPTVPDTLPELAGPTTATAGQDEADRKSVDFENDITTRLASLRGLGAGVNLDPFGMPVAPTFRPEERATPTKRAGGAARYTDEDQKTWCIVCLDDATIKCIGCDNDVYCSRCWRDMHLGPAAGWDERGHRWVRFERPS